MSSWDVVVVGSGACGALASRLLTSGGLNVLLVDAGPEMPELEPQRINQLRQSRCLGFEERVRHLYVDDALHPYTTAAEQPFVWIRGRQLGGRTHQWGLGTPRWDREEFEAAWPIEYDELLPHYRAVESLLGVCGGAEAAGEPASEGHQRAREWGAAERDFALTIEKRWPGRRVVVFPQAAAKGDLARHLLQRQVDGGMGPTPASLCHRSRSRQGQLTIRANTIVRAVAVASCAQRATGVHVIDRVTCEAQELSARYVVLCASALESTRILLNSGTSRSGLANSSGALGLYLTDHLWGVGVSAVAQDPTCRIDRQRNPPLLIPPYCGSAGHLSQLQLVCSFQPGDDGRAYLRIDAHGRADSRAQNCVRIDPEVEDAWGIPGLRIEYERTAADRGLGRAMLEASREVAEVAGYSVLRCDEVPMLPGLSVHELGTARMGRDPSSSVVNPFCQSWDVPNLLVCDGSIFPSAGVRNPTLTMMAVTSWACTHLLRAA